MDLDDAVRAHAAWKQKLAAYLQKPDKSINPSTLEKDNQCDLGKWLYAEGARYASSPGFPELKKEHAGFHRSAADVVRRADRGERVTEELGLGGKSEYSRCSSAVVQAIIKLKQSLPRGEFLDEGAFQRAKEWLAVVRKDSGYRLALPFLDHAIHVEELHVELPGQQFADRGLARAHEAHQNDVALAHGSYLRSMQTNADLLRRISFPSATMGAVQL